MKYLVRIFAILSFLSSCSDAVLDASDSDVLPLQSRSNDCDAPSLHDGDWIALSSHSEGNGIPVVLMGDGFTQAQMDNGEYVSVMESACDAMFAVEPFHSLKSMFDVYAVCAVSATEGIAEHGSGIEQGETALGCWHGGSTMLEGDHEKCYEYIKSMGCIDSWMLCNVLAIVIVNTKAYAGSTYLWYYSPCLTDYGEGWSVSYIGMPSVEKMGRLLRHEACGHGFAKLADEYGHNEPDSASIAESEAVCRQYEKMGWYKNIDTTQDSAMVKWSAFLHDADYSSEMIGIYEGGLSFTSHFYRPTETSIMKNNSGEFNAPSRQAIYHRMHKLSYGDAWQYDHDDFKKYDLSRHAPAIDTGIKPITRFDVDDTDFPLLPSPVIEMIDVSSYIRR